MKVKKLFAQKQYIKSLNCDMLISMAKKLPIGLCFALIFLMSASYVNAISIGISPGRVKFENVLRNGYAERIITVSTASDDELIASFKPQGEIKEWLDFEPNTTTFRVTRENPYKLKIKVQPPSDVRVGNYSGSIEFITEGIGDISGRAGSLIKTAVTLTINVEVTGKEIINCRAGAFSFNDAEEKFPFEFGYTIINDGNVRLKPLITLDVWDQLQEKLLLTKDFIGDEVLPTTEKRISGSLQNALGEGQYWVNMEVNECKSNGMLTFSVVEKGGIADRGELTEIINKPWAYTNETVQITAKFQNSGKRSVTARFKGTIRLDDKIVKLIETEEIIVPVGETADFDIFFVPEIPGRYTINGRAVYNKKLTFEKGTVLNVNPAAEEKIVKKFSFLPLLIYIAIIMTIFFIVRKIIKEKKRKKIF